jgi:hypothetical protein
MTSCSDGKTDPDVVFDVVFDVTFDVVFDITFDVVSETSKTAERNI